MRTLVGCLVVIHPLETVSPCVSTANEIRHSPTQLACYIDYSKRAFSVSAAPLLHDGIRCPRKLPARLCARHRPDSEKDAVEVVTIHNRRIT